MARVELCLCSPFQGLDQAVCLALNLEDLNRFIGGACR